MIECQHPPGTDAPPICICYIPGMSGLLAGKVTVITGAGNGIGAATARLFAEEEAAAVVVSDVDGDAAEKVAATIGGRATAARVDVRDPAQLRALHDQVLGEHGRVDVLVNNAGHYIVPTAFGDSTANHWQALYEINLLHVFHATHLFLPTMIGQASGAIINVSSIEGIRGYPIDPVYGAFKAAVVHFTKCLGVDVAPHGVRVNAIAPDLTNSAQSNFAEWDPPEVAQRWSHYLPVGRMGQPVEQARVVTFLASEQSGFLVGQTINTDGGTAEAAGWYRSDRRPGRRWTNRPFDP
jgi:NAD(P)-dependent dehydrogenase (short-subunit alcohol dehydrogenase family)